MAEERLTQRGNCAPAGGPPAATSGAMQEPHASDNNVGDAISWAGFNVPHAGAHETRAASAWTDGQA